MISVLISVSIGAQVEAAQERAVVDAHHAGERGEPAAGRRRRAAGSRSSTAAAGTNGTFVVVPPFMYGDATTMRAPLSWAVWSIRVMWSGE